MNLTKLSKPAFWAAILGSAKLTADAFGLNFISDEQINSLVIILSAAVALIGVYVSHDKPK